MFQFAAVIMCFVAWKCLRETWSKLTLRFFLLFSFCFSFSLLFLHPYILRFTCSLANGYTLVYYLLIQRCIIKKMNKYILLHLLCPIYEPSIQWNHPSFITKYYDYSFNICFLIYWTGQLILEMVKPAKSENVRESCLI